MLFLEKCGNPCAIPVVGGTILVNSSYLYPVISIDCTPDECSKPYSDATLIFPTLAAQYINTTLGVALENATKKAAGLSRFSGANKFEYK